MKLGFASKDVRIIILNLLLTIGNGAIISSTANLLAADCAPPPFGLVSWWPGENNGNDIIGGNNGTWAGFGNVDAYSPGTVGQAFVFDGTHRDRVDVGNPTNLQLQNFTIETWIKRSSATVASMDDNFADGSIAGDGAYIFGYGAGGYGLFLTDSGEVGLTKNSSGDVRVPPVITDTNWHHVAVTKSGTSVAIYVDGVLQPSPGPDSAVFEFTTSAAIGSRGDGGGNTFFGSVDELSIYNRALSADEIAAIYNADSAGKCASSGSGILAGPINNPANGHCYYLLESNTWMGAEAQAVTLGGHLVTINDAAEQDWVVKTFSNFGGVGRNLWIGLYDPTRDANGQSHASNFVWVNGEPVTYTDWSSGEPNNYNDGEYFASIFGPPDTRAPFWNDSDNLDSLNAEGQVIFPTYGVVEVASCDKTCVHLPSDLVSWWPAEGNGQDAFGTNNGTLLGGATFTNGEVGQSFSFNGNGQGVLLGNPPSLQLQNFTIEGWVKRASASVVTLAPAQTTAAFLDYGYGGYGFGVYDDGGIFLTRVGINNITIPGLLTGTNWHHVAVTKSGTNVAFYVDGAMYPAPSPYTSTFTFSSNIALGARGDNMGNSFLGFIDELSIYNRALSSNEIAAIYNAGSAGKCSSSPCVNYPDFSSISGLTLAGTSTVINNTLRLTPAAAGQTGTAWLTDKKNCLNGFDTSFHFQITQLGNIYGNEPGGDGFSFSIQNVSPTNTAWALSDTNNSVAVFFNTFWNWPGCSDPVTCDASDNSVGIYINQSYIGQADLNPTGINMSDGAVHSGRIAYDGTNMTVWVDGQMVLTNVPVPQLHNAVDNAGKAWIGLTAGTGAAYENHDILDWSFCNNGSTQSETNTLVNVPAIYNFSPKAATNGAVLAIVGTNFSSVVSSNIVFFGAVRANVLAATPTSLTVIVPTGATYAPITETVNGLTASANQSFMPTFIGDGSGIGPSSFGPRVDLSSGKGPNKIVIADLDGDGKPDLIVANDYNNTISLYRNISNFGSLTTNSFAPAVDLTTPPGQYSPFGLVVADVDGDGKLDIVVSDYDNSIVSVYRNSCTPGNISSNLFSPRVDFATGTHPQGIEVRDIDGDGRPDILTANTGDGSISILRNTGAAGGLTTNSFAPRVDITTGSGCDSLVVGDLDGDGKPDVATANNGSGTISVLRNISSPGSIIVNSFAPKADITVLSGLIQLTIGDLDGDGKQDLAVASYLPMTLSVLRNIGTIGNLTSNSFAPRVDFSLGGRGHSPIFADLDGDGKPDISVVTELNSLLSIYRNTSTPGSFTTTSLAPRVDFSTGWNAWGVAAGDLDGDGRPDIAFCNTYDNNISIYQNRVPFNGKPVITSQPTNQIVIDGDKAAFTVVATGIMPFTYQWFFNGNPIDGATNSSLVLPEAQLTQAGSYFVIVSNVVASATSSNAILTVTMPYCTPPPVGLVSWWPGEESAQDAAGTNNGTLVGNVTYAPGKDGDAFHLNAIHSGINIGNPTNLQLQNFTIEAWIKRGSSTAVTWDTPYYQTAGILDCSWGGYGLGLANDGRLFLTKVGYSAVYSTRTITDTNSYHHVAATKVGSTVFLFIDGLGEQVGPYDPGFVFNGPTAIGARGSDYFNTFLGSIDEVSIYNRALSTNEIAAIYAARGAGKCPLPPTILSVTPPSWYVNEGSTVAYAATAAGSPKLTYQWKYEGADMIGATNSTLTLSNVVYAQAGNYSVVVSNVAGMVSSNVTLRVNRAPIADASATDTLLISPNDTNAIAVLDGSRSSDPDGDPLTYAWFHTGDATPFATTVVAMNTLPVGTNQLTLVVNDGMASGSQNFAIEVITTSQAVDRLIALIQAGSTNAQSLVASLKAALASIDRSQPQAAINQLEAFINKVQAQLAPDDPDLAAQLIADAQAIIDALNGGSPVVATTVEISSISHGHGGKSHLKVKGASGRVYVVETSTNMVDWVPVGVATKTADGGYDFDDAQSSEAGTRFYRVVSPK